MSVFNCQQKKQGHGNRSSGDILLSVDKGNTDSGLIFFEKRSHPKTIKDKPIDSYSLPV